MWITTLQNRSKMAIFLILTYNQEGFTEATIKGALAQEGPSLKILISDDCSNTRIYQ